MRFRAIFVGILLSITFVFTSKAQQDEFPVLKGPYLGQKPPGMIPEIFAPGIISTNIHEACLVFSPDGKEVFYRIMDYNHSYYAIVFMEYVNGLWKRPRIAPFSGKYRDADLFFSPGGNKLYFTSDRPLTSGKESGNLDIWVVKRINNVWGKPQNIGPPVNSEKVDVNPAVSKTGTLYFASNREGGKGSHDIYLSKPDNGSFSEPKNLGEAINSPAIESGPFIPPDESYIIFNRYYSTAAAGLSGLHISFKNENGTWSKAVNMGELFNAKTAGMHASVSHDGKFLFFTSTSSIHFPNTDKVFTYEEIIRILNSPQNGLGNIYWVDAKIIEELKPEELK